MQIEISYIFIMWQSRPLILHDHDIYATRVSYRQMLFASTLSDTALKSLSEMKEK